MTVPAHEVAAALRARIPALPTKKLHKLLYYCQGHHLATLGEPLFAETIAAWDMGPVVGQLWSAENRGTTPESSGDLGEAELNTVGYVVSRYGRLSGGDLERLTHAEDPWRLADAARPPHTSSRIERSWIEAWFRGPGGAVEDDEPALDADEVRAWLAGAEARKSSNDQPDDVEALRARLIGRS